MSQPLGGPPQQRRAAQVDQRAVLQDVRLVVHRLALLLGRSALAQAEHVPADGRFAPQAALGRPAAELTLRVHDQDAVRREAVDLHVVLPFGGLFLRNWRMMDEIYD